MANYDAHVMVEHNGVPDMETCGECRDYTYPVGSEWEDVQGDIWTVLVDGQMHCEVGNTTTSIETVEFDYGPLRLYREVGCYDCETGGYNCSAHRSPTGRTQGVTFNFGVSDVGPAVKAIDKAVASVLSCEAVGDRVFTTKDSGQREVYPTGMQRDTAEGKARWDLLLPKDVPYEAQFLTRFADLMARGAVKYDARNWEKAGTDEELERFKQSAYRHLVQFLTGDTEEDHAVAVVFNLLAHETTKWKMENK